MQTPQFRAVGARGPRYASMVALALSACGAASAHASEADHPESIQGPEAPWASVRATPFHLHSEARHLESSDDPADDGDFTDWIEDLWDKLFPPDDPEEPPAEDPPSDPDTTW